MKKHYRRNDCNGKTTKIIGGITLTLNQFKNYIFMSDIKYKYKFVTKHLNKVLYIVTNKK